MLSIFYNKTALQDTLIITINDKTPDNIKQLNDFVYGTNNNGELLFVNVFNLSKYIALPEGYLRLDKNINNLLIKHLHIDLFKYNSVLPFVVGEVLKCDHIDNSHLQICQVNVGNELLSIVCGASNVAIGLKVIVARSGTIMPNGLVIKSNKIMNHVSNGMICSARELNLKKHSYNNDGIVQLPISSTAGKNFMEVFNN